MNSVTIFMDSASRMIPFRHTRLSCCNELKQIIFIEPGRIGGWRTTHVITVASAKN